MSRRWAPQASSSNLGQQDTSTCLCKNFAILSLRPAQTKSIFLSSPLTIQKFCATSDFTSTTGALFCGKNLNESEQKGKITPKNSATIPCRNHCSKTQKSFSFFFCKGQTDHAEHPQQWLWIHCGFEFRSKDTITPNLHH